MPTSAPTVHTADVLYAYQDLNFRCQLVVAQFVNEVQPNHSTCLKRRHQVLGNLPDLHFEVFELKKYVWIHPNVIPMKPSSLSGQIGSKVRSLP